MRQIFIFTEEALEDRHAWTGGPAITKHNRVKFFNGTRMEPVYVAEDDVQFIHDTLRLGNGEELERIMALHRFDRDEFTKAVKKLPWYRRLFNLF